MGTYEADFSNFQSAIEWPDLRPPEEEATDVPKPLCAFLPALLDNWALAATIESVCESPIEVELGTQFLIALRAAGDEDWKLVPQYVLGPYRYDFAITRQKKLACLIECDGKEFHSTREQLANDRAKDKMSAETGVRIFRFSGSDIHRDPKSCVRDVLHAIIFKDHLTPDQWDALNLALVSRASMAF
jgi:very-short-patch-repair endonuclease